jgi:uncharacterized phage-like protein YoqJ
MDMHQKNGYGTRYTAHPFLCDFPIAQSLCFTGHRPEKLPDGDALRLLKETLYYYIDYAVECGYTYFYTGLADGIDLYAADYLFYKRISNPDIFVIGVQPCTDYEKFFRTRGYSISRLQSTIAALDLLVKMPGSCKDRGIFRERNYLMVEHSSALIAVCGSKPSGSSQTLRYAQKQGLAYCHIHSDRYRTDLCTPEDWPTDRKGF